MKMNHSAGNRPLSGSNDWLSFYFLFPIVLVAWLASPAKGDILLEETFSGTGIYSSSGGISGFENAGWNNTGAVGSFLTNSFGENVYQATSTDPAPFSQDGVFRGVGTDAFSVTAEFSNPVLTSNGFTTAGLSVADSPDQVNFAVRNFGGSFHAGFFASVDGDTFDGGGLDLGSNVDRFTMQLDYEPDLINGGGLFSAYIDVNESGVFNFVGSFDGLIYSTNAISNRALFLGSTGFQDEASVQLDYVSLSNNAIPEPAMMSLLSVGLTFISLRRRRALV